MKQPDQSNGALLEGERKLVKRELIARSPWNPRKTFHLRELEELAGSIREHGVIQDLLVRPLPPGNEDLFHEYELVAGEKRWRASEIAGLVEVPVIVRDLSEREVREIQIIENLQRSDLSAHEEATGYLELLRMKDESGRDLYSVDTIARRIGKDPTYVRQRLKVCHTPKILLDALDAGRIGVRICEIVGRIPHPEDREACAEEVLNPPYKDVLTKQETQELVNEKYMKSLNRAGFDTGDEDLLPDVGACSGCPHRSGNDPTLAAEISRDLGEGRRGKTLGLDPNVCTNVACFRRKEEAAWYQIVEEEGAGGVLDEETAAVEFHGDGLRYGSKYVAVNRPPARELVKDYGELEETWKELAGPELPTIKARNPHNGEVWELAEKKVALASAALEAEKRDRPSPFREHVRQGEDANRKRKAELEESNRKRMEVMTGLDLLSEKMAEAGGLSREALLVLLEVVLDENAENCRTLGKWLEVAPVKPAAGMSASPRDYIPGILEHVAASRYSETDLLVFIACASIAANLSWAGISTRYFKRFAKIYGLEAGVIRRTARLRLKAIKAAKKTRPAGGKKKASGKSAGAAPPPPPDDQEGEDQPGLEGALAFLRNHPDSPSATIETAALRYDVDPEELVRGAVRLAAEWYDGQDAGTVTLQNAADKFGVEVKRLRNFRMNASRKGGGK